ncbi:MAG: hypothetical protein CMO81_08375 [Waddliaceae bacterium]|nr:hypothetical protein [Waddliaceae bacterium]
MTSEIGSGAPLEDNLDISEFYEVNPVESLFSHLTEKIHSLAVLGSSKDGETQIGQKIAYDSGSDKFYISGQKIQDYVPSLGGFSTWALTVASRKYYGASSDSLMESLENSLNELKADYKELEDYIKKGDTEENLSVVKEELEGRLTALSSLFTNSKVVLVSSLSSYTEDRNKEIKEKLDHFIKEFDNYILLSENILNNLKDSDVDQEEDIHELEKESEEGGSVRDDEGVESRVETEENDLSSSLSLNESTSSVGPEDLEEENSTEEKREFSEGSDDEALKNKKVEEELPSPEKVESNLPSEIAKLIVHEDKQIQTNGDTFLTDKKAIEKVEKQFKALKKMASKILKQPYKDLKLEKDQRIWHGASSFLTGGSLRILKSNNSRQITEDTREKALFFVRTFTK